MALNGFEPLKYGSYWIFLRFLAATHILRVNCAEKARDVPGHFAHDIFLA